MSRSRDYLTLADIIGIYSILMKRYGGASGIRYKGAPSRRTRALNPPDPRKSPLPLEAKNGWERGEAVTGLTFSCKHTNFLYLDVS